MNLISQEELDVLMMNRDMGMYRIHVVTELRKRQLQANSLEEYFSIPFPRIFPISNSIFDEAAIDKAMHTNLDIFSDMYCRGLNIIDNEWGYVCRYGNLGSVVSSDLFRGENRVYESECTSTLGRICRETAAKESPQKAFVDFVIAQMRIYLFTDFLTHFHQFCDYPFGLPLPNLIAQHYGIPTQFLDLTDDIKVALFLHVVNTIRKHINIFLFQLMI